MKAKAKKIVCFSVSAVILAIIVAVNVAVGIYADLLNRFVVGYKNGTSGDAGARAEGAALAEQIQYEGTVLVQNEDNVLPLDKEDVPAVNVFGWSSTQWVYGGSGSGQVQRANVDFLKALKDYGIEYNTELTDMYRKFQGSRQFTDALHSFNYEFSRLYEPSINNKNIYSQSILDNALKYSDTAIVVIGRVSGESNDSPKVQYKKNTSSSSIVTDPNRTYLEISEEEEDLLKYVGENYENVIVLINSTNVIELGFLEDIAGLDACLIVGTTGTSAASAIPKLLYGEYTPSGKTTDTYAYDLSTSSTYANSSFGNDTTSFYTNSSGLYPTTVTHTNGSSNVPYQGVAYTDYAEGIYLGYKWYETADVEGFWSSDYAKEHWNVSSYDEVVQYPFGYGLSYTTFSWNVTYTSHPNGATVTGDDEIVIQVDVKNTGNHPGQDVVQLYYNPPYTKGGIEKAAVNLCAFAKTTKVLKPGENQIVELKFKVSDMKSYDFDDSNRNNITGYELEAGNYELSIRTDAHTVATEKLGANAKLTVKVENNIHLDKDDVSGKKVDNLFTGEDAVDGVAIDGNSDGTAEITYLSRASFGATFPWEKKPQRAMANEVKAFNLYTSAMATAWIDNTDKPIITGDTSKGGYVYDKEADAITDLGVQLGNPDNFDDDDLWDPVLNRLNINEMKNLVLHGYSQTAELDSIGKYKTRDLDGPNQIGSFGDASDATGFSSIVLAQTWNVELSYSMGLTIGREAANKTVNGWYGPGLNLHRTPFGGRNFEYYSEDAYLSGMMAAYSVKAAKNAGVYSYLKHICLYESESGRDGMYNWLTEQSLRELYIKPFEIAIKQGGATGIMTSYGRIGAVWTGGSKALLTDLVREEWGFKGGIITDYSDHQEFMNVDQMIRAGGDLWMENIAQTQAFRWDSSSNSFNQALRRANKNVIYMWLNALATNKDYNDRIANGEIDGVPIITKSPELKFRWYIPVLVALDVLAVGGCGVWIWLVLRKKNKAEAVSSTETTEQTEQVEQTQLTDSTKHTE